MRDPLITFSGSFEILVAVILTLKPSVIYDSPPTRALASLTGLHLSNADSAPGFNQAIACMVAAVGVCHLIAARCGPAAKPPIFAMYVTWAVLGLLTCATPQSWGLGNATVLFSSLNHVAISLAMYVTDKSVIQLGAKQKEMVKKED